MTVKETKEVIIILHEACVIFNSFFRKSADSASYKLSETDLDL